jgi:hypothetical protein
MTQIRRFVAKDADTIHFIGNRCPLFVTLQVVISPWPRLREYSVRTTKRPKRFCEFEPITMTLQYVGQSCSSLETLRAMTSAVPCKQSAAGTADRDIWRCHEEIRGLRLTMTQVYLREELIQARLETCLRKTIEEESIKRIVTDTQYDLWHDLNRHGSGGRW